MTDFWTLYIVMILSGGLGLTLLHVSIREMIAIALLWIALNISIKLILDKALSE